MSTIPPLPQGDSEASPRILNNPKRIYRALLYVRLSDRRLLAAIEPSREVAAEPTRWQKLRDEQCVSEQAARQLAQSWVETLGASLSFTEKPAAPQPVRYKRWISEETRAKMRAAKLGKPRSAAAREALRLGHLGKKRGPFPKEWREAISAGRRAGIEARKKAALTINNESPEAPQKQSNELTT